MNYRNLNCKGNALRQIPCILLVLFLLHPIAAVAQAAAVSLTVKNISLKEMLNEIEKNSTIRFSYKDVALDTKKDITLSVNNEPVEHVLDNVLPGKQLEYVRTGNTIAIKKLAAKTSNSSTKKKVTGTVTDTNGEPIIGAIGRAHV